ncbi:MAG: BACON domain-containing protein, partial [Blastocatellia bacterium]
MSVNSFTATGGGTAISVTAQGGCTWTATSNASWLTITSGSSGAGNGTVAFTVAANTLGPRTGVVTINNQTFTVTQAGVATPRVIRVVATNAAPGSSGLAVPIELVAQGDENALGFTLSFDPALLSNPQAALGADAAGAQLATVTTQTAQGRLGLGLALAAGQKFAAGTRQIAVVTFNLAATATAGMTTLDFGDQPLAREVSDASAGVIPASYTAGSLTVVPGYEADVSPRPNGNNNGTLTITDWVQVGRFVAGLDAAAAGAEFQRADCA